jgi:hypothetical protein
MCSLTQHPLLPKFPRIQEAQRAKVRSYRFTTPHFSLENAENAMALFTRATNLACRVQRSNTLTSRALHLHATASLRRPHDVTPGIALAPPSPYISKPLLINISSSTRQASKIIQKRFNSSSSNDFRASGGWLTEKPTTDEVEGPLWHIDTSASSSNQPTESNTKDSKMPIIHIVLFEFKPTTTHAQVEDVRQPIPTQQTGLPNL